LFPGINPKFKITKEQAFPNILSFVLHPILMPTAGTLFILFFSGLYITTLPAEAKQIILLIVGVCTLAIPAALLSFFRMHRLVGSLYISRRSERIAPLLLTAVLYFVAYRVLHELHTPYTIQKFVLASTIAVFATSLISIRWKISIHGVGIGGFTGMLAALATVSPAVLHAMLVAVILSGLAGYARIRLNAHTPAQYYAGVLLGFAITFGLFFKSGILF
jgi:hypothetical protein